MYFAKRNAIITQKLHKIVFDIQKKRIYVLTQDVSSSTAPSDQPTDTTFKPVTRSFIATAIPLPDYIIIEHFYIGDRDEIAQFETRDAAEKMWFYINQEGTVQDVLITMYDTVERKKKMPGQFSLQINPFSGKITRYDYVKKR